MRRNSALVLTGLMLTAIIAIPACGKAPAVVGAPASQATPGYTLVAPAHSTETYLIDLEGRIVHRWEGRYSPGQSVYLLENGHLLRTGSYGHEREGVFRGGGIGGVVEEYDWDNNLVWTFEYATDEHWLHHDIEPLPNGNVLMIAWERKTREEAIAAGRNPSLVNEAGMWTDCVIEVKPTRPEGGEIVWEWRVWDHLVQDLDPEKANHGSIEDSPARINVNPPDWIGELSDEQREQLEALGYLAASPSPDPNGHQNSANPDWNHTNSVDYNPRLDQIVLSVLGQNELWIIDHGTSTEEAAGSDGDLLYRWGDPTMYKPVDDPQTLFAQHDVHWIPEGCPGAGNLLLFNNGRGRTDGDYSSVDEIVLPVSATGEYRRAEDGSFAPAEMVWTYAAPDKDSFYSPNISGAQRLPTGNTLICSGAQARIFEVSADAETVWEYTLPGGGNLPGGGPGGPGVPGGPGGPGGPRGPGGPDFTKHLFDMLDTDQNGQLNRDEFAKLPMPGRPGGRREGMRGPGFPGAGGPPFGGGQGPPGTNVFRAPRYLPDYPAFSGKAMDPGASLEEEIGDSSSPRG